jgi:hypothetical protein
MSSWIVAVVLALTAAASTARAAQIDVKQRDRVRVLKAADAYLKEEPITVTAASSPRSVGGKHDFFSEGDYWWPDPADPDGPYIQKDGMTNPDNFVAHRRAMVRMSRIVAALTAAHLITGDDKYAEHAIKHLKAWFVDDETKMSPHLLYAQAIKGRFTGRGIGVIDTVHLIEPARSSQLLEKSGQLTGDDLAATKKWFADYLTWMTTHKYGIDEMNAENNHGTCWVMQVAAFASFTGDEEKLAFCRKRYKDVLLPNQMAEDGSFPRELKRTKPYGYAIFNADAMATVCRVLSTREENLWTFQTPDGKSMRKGVAWLHPYIADKSKWPYKQDVMYWDEWPVRSPVLLFGGLAYDEQKYLDTWKTLDANPMNEEVLRNLPIHEPVLWVD